MKKIILSVAVAAMALTTTASALEDIKVNGQAKLWYETWDKGEFTPTTGGAKESNSLFNQESASGTAVFTLGVTGKQGNVGFGASFVQTSTMGLENNLVNSTRYATATNESGSEMYTSEMYITVPVGAKTMVKIGKQKVNTPLAFSEGWNATPNTFNAALAINSSIKNLTLIAGYIGQSNGSGNFKTNGEVDNVFFDGAQALAALYKNDTIAANAFYYHVGNTANAVWLDASGKVGPVAVKGIVTQLMPITDYDGKDDTTAAAISVAGKAGAFSLSAAYSTVSKKGFFAAGNTATGFKKTKLPTAGVYTDGLYVAQPGSNAIKVKAVTKLAGTKLIFQAINNTNDKSGLTTGANGFTPASRETTEIDLIAIKKIGDLNLKGILLNRSFDDDATDKASGGNHIRVIASVNF